MNREIHWSIKERLCTECGEDDPSAFGYRRASRCKECQKKRERERHYEHSKDINYVIKRRLEAIASSKKFKEKNRLAVTARRARKKGLAFELTDSFFKELVKKQENKCAYSGIEFEKEGPFALSIDRIDSDKGYLQNNVQLVCIMINVMKNKFSEKEFLKVIEVIYKHKIK